MAEKQIFVKSEIQEVLSPDKYIHKELLEDLSAIPEPARKIVAKALRGETLESKERGIYDTARRDWWQNKYGFPITMKAARNEVLRKKYSPDEATEATRKIQVELISAIEAGDANQINKLKEIYQAEFPDQLEGVELLFGLPDFLAIDRKLKGAEKISPEKRRGMFRELTEFQFLITHYLITNGGEKDFLKLFWEVSDKVADKMNSLKTWQSIRRGVLGQVSSYRIIDAIGQKPVLSHPDEDAFNSVDLWSANETALQIKSSQYVTEPALMESDQMSSTSIKTSTEKDDLYFTDKYFHDNQSFNMSIKKLGEKTHRNIKGYFLVIPVSKIDFVTGEPDKGLIEFFKNKINQAEKI